MELYNRCIAILDANVILCLIPIIVTLVLVERIFKDRFDTKSALNLVRWILISYAAITTTVYLTGMVINPKAYAFFNRATGPYALIYWVMFLGAAILPFTLLNKTLASKFWYLTLVAFGIKSGVYIERYIIIITSLHRDYLPNNWNDTHKIHFFEWIHPIVLRCGTLVFQGIIIAFLILGVFEMIKRKNTPIAD